VDPSVTTGLFALGGVVVGGFVNGAVTYSMERRREGWAARRAARLFAPCLHRLAYAADSSLREGTSWAELADVVPANLEEWPAHADVFAGTLEWEQWFDIYAAVRVWEQFTWGQPSLPDRALIRPGTKGAAYVETLRQRALEGAVTCAVVANSGVRRRRVRNVMSRLRWRMRPPTEDVLIDEAVDKSASLPFDFDAPVRSTSTPPRDT
jgi:hypothetical protein